METQYFWFTNHRYIVFCMTGHNAGSTTGTGIQIHTHAPFDTGFIVIWIDGSVLFVIVNSTKWCQFLFTVFNDLFGLFFEMVQSQFLHNFSTVTLCCIISTMCLGQCNFKQFIGQFYLHIVLCQV